MPAFTFKSPEGESYTLNGPDGATPEQAFGVLQQHLTSQRAQGIVPISMKDADNVRVPDLSPQIDEDESFSHGLAKGAKSLAGLVAHGVGTVADIGRNDVRAVSGQPTVEYGSPESYATKLSKPFATLPTAQQVDLEAKGAKTSAAVSGAYDSVAGTSPAAATVKENILPALEAISTVVPIAGKVGAIADGSRASAAATAARVAAPAASPLEAVQRAGYQIRPSDVPARNPTVNPSSVPGSLRESITSSPQQTESMVRNNAALSTRLIGEDIGVPNATKLTEAHYQAAERAPGQVYEQTGQAMGQLRDVQRSTIDNLRAVATDQTPQGAVPATARTQLNRMIEGLQSGQYGGTQLIHDISYLRNQVGGAGGRAAAGVLEGEMEHQLAGSPETLANFRAARTQFAKIRNARDSTTGGLIDAADYKRISEANPELLTGNSATVAQAGGEIPHLTRIPRPTADQTPIAGTAFKTVMNAAARGASHLPFMDITNPALQARIGRAAPAPGPLPVAPGLARTAAPPPSPMGVPPGSVGVTPSQLGLALTPGRPAAPAFELAPPEGPVIEPLQRGNPLPRATSLQITRQILDQIRRRNGQLPGTLDHDE